MSSNQAMRISNILIAISLVWICERDIPFVAEALASQGPIEVKVVQIEFDRFRPIPVELKGSIVCTPN